MGSFIRGFLFIETLERLTLSPPLRTGILTGFMGGYTTFSTFEMESVLLAEGGELIKARFTWPYPWVPDSRRRSEALISLGTSSGRIQWVTTF